MSKLVFSLFLVTFMAHCIWGCASQKIMFSTASAKSFDDGSFDIKHRAILPSGDTVSYPEVRVFWQWLEFVASDSQTVSALLIRPTAGDVDVSQLMCVVGGYRVIPNSLYGFALQVAATGRSVLVLIPRGYDRNSSLPMSHGVKEVDDLRYALNLYLQLFKTDSLTLNLFTSSSGLNIALSALLESNNIAVKNAVIESPILSLAEAIKKDVPDEVASTIKSELEASGSSIEHFDLSQLLTTRAIQNALVVRGSKDEIVSDNEFDLVLAQIRRAIPNTDTIISACSQHNIRQIVPCDTSAAHKLDTKVMHWLQSKW